MSLYTDLLEQIAQHCDWQDFMVKECAIGPCDDIERYTERFGLKFVSSEQFQEDGFWPMIESFLDKDEDHYWDRYNWHGQAGLQWTHDLLTGLWDMSHKMPPADFQRRWIDLRIGISLRQIERDIRDLNYNEQPHGQKGRYIDHIRAIIDSSKGRVARDYGHHRNSRQIAYGVSAFTYDERDVELDIAATSKSAMTSSLAQVIAYAMRSSVLVCPVWQTQINPDYQTRIEQHVQAKADEEARHSEKRLIKNGAHSWMNRSGTITIQGWHGTMRHPRKWHNF
jgi:hypothetical protein